MRQRSRLAGNCLQTALVLTIFGLFATNPSRAAVIYVDNRIGSDAFDGAAIQPVSSTTGPVRTIARALQLAAPSDVISLANRGIPYEESITLSGARHSGSENAPFTILGNGAAISGMATVPIRGWTNVDGALWKVTPVRKGHFLLFRNNQPLPEHACSNRQSGVLQIPAGHWCAWRGSIYYRTHPGDDPRLQAITIAFRTAGLTLIDVHDVLIRDLTISGFRLDGINAHDRTRRINLDNVRLHHNARSGLAINGTSHVNVRNSVLTNNRLYQVLITELGVLDIEESELSEPPQIVD